MRKLNFKELVAENKEQLLKDKEAMEKIEKRIEEKAIKTAVK
ncbi:FbpB family small basic protein [Calidifontibacillus oryziterrae]|nr:FbpB family small basic protein [Calidifontibacillus oryziterrae]